MGQSIGDLIRGRTEVYDVKPWESIREASRYMAERKIGAVAVRDESGSFRGVFSERDLLKRVVAKGLDLDLTPVSEVMTRELAIARPDESCLVAAERMKSRGTRHLIILDGDRYLGMISQSDLTSAFLEEVSEERDLLKHYAFPER